MATISELPAKTAYKLSMGQVVTSVLSVVKELVENAIDSGALSIDVRLDDFGLEKIEVRDNGSGVAPDDVALMALAHHTSKIHTLDDLGSSVWLGFRGEALAAVCAACRVAVATRTAAEHVGRLVTLDAEGRVTNQQPIARAQGTTVTAAGLFWRQPVRRQMYASARRRRDQLRAVETLLTATAVCRPRLRLALHHNNSQLIVKAPCETMKSAAVQVLKCELARSMETLTLGDDQVRIEALLPPADAPVKLSGRSTSDQSFISVNGRVVTHKSIEKVLRRVYSTRHGLAPARYPVCALRVSVPPDQLDANLEPNKTAVFLICEEKVLQLLEEGLTRFYHVESPALTVAPVEAAAPPGLHPSWDAAAPAAHGGCVAPRDPSVADGGDCVRGPTTDAGEDGIKASARSGGETAHPPTPAVSGTEAPDTHGSVLLPAAAERPSADPPTATVLLPAAAGRPPADSPTASTAANASDDSLFGDNFRGVSIGEDRPPSVQPGDALSDCDLFEPSPGGLHAAWDHMEAEGVQVKRQNGGGGKNHDPWASGNMLDSQGHIIQPTELVTAYCGGPVSEWARTPASGDVRTAAPPSAAAITARHTRGPATTAAAGQKRSPAPPTSDQQQPSIALWTTLVSVADSDPARVVPTSADHAKSNQKAAVKQERSAAVAVEGPPPTKRARQDTIDAEYEPVASQVVRKASSAFVFYCRDMRRKYLSLDPEMPVGALSAALADGWRAAPPSVRREYEMKARQDQLRYQEEVRRVQLAEISNTPRRTVSSNGGDVMSQLRRMVAPLTPEARARRPPRPTATMSSAKVTESVNQLEMSLKQTRCAASGGTAARVLGALQSHSGWLVLHCHRLYLVNAERLCEVVTERRLLSSCQLPRQLLPQSPAVPAALLSCLRRLPSDGARITDTRVTDCGFEVDVVGDSGRITAAPECAGSDAVQELCALLERIAAEPEVPLQRCRPPRVTAWLQAEAARIARGDGAHMCREEVRALVEAAGDLDTACCHGRPLAAPLCPLPTS